MATILSKEHYVIQVDSDPSAGGGTPSPIGQLAMLSTGGVGSIWRKNSATNTDWSQLGTGNGSVTSVGLSITGPLFTISNSPVTGSGTLTATLNDEPANTVFAGPATGSPATPTFRALVAADIPSLAYVSSVTAGTGLNVGAGPGGTITTTGTLNLAATAVSAGSYTLTNLTVDAQGRLTNASSGTVNLTTQVTNVLPIANGGTNLSTTPTNGQLLIGNGTGYSLSTLTAGTGITITNGSGTITINSTTATPASKTKTANYTILTTDETIFVDSSGGAFTLTLPSPSTLDGHRFYIVDKAGSLNTNNVTLARSASEKIEGLAASKLLQTDWGYFIITTDATDWYVG